MLQYLALFEFCGIEMGPHFIFFLCVSVFFNGYVVHLIKEFENRYSRSYVFLFYLVALGVASSSNIGLRTSISPV